MPPRDGEPPVLVRIVEGVAARSRWTATLRVRFGYGQIVPWMRAVTDGTAGGGRPRRGLAAHPGPADRAQTCAHEATFTVQAGERVPFVLG